MSAKPRRPRAPSASDLKELNSPTVEFVLLADRVEALNGKLYVMGGGWDRLFVSDIKKPTTISFAVAILVPWNATNQQHAVTLAIEDTDGHNIGFTLEAGFNTGRPPWSEQGETQRVTIAVPAAAVLFPRYGCFAAKAYVNGQPSCTSEFRVVEPPVGLPMIGQGGLQPQ